MDSSTSLARGLVAVCLLLSPVASAQDFEGGPRAWMDSSWMLRRDNVLSAITDTHVIDVRTGEVREGVTIAFWGDEIELVEPDLRLVGAATVDGSGLWIVPGLIDLHAHVIPPSRFFPDSAPPEETLATLLDFGVTTIRGLPFFSESAGVWSGRINAGLLKGPTIVPVSGIFEQQPQRTSVGFGTPQIARSWVAREALLGTRWIKVYNAMDEASLAAIVDEAARHGLRVCGHAEGVAPLRAAQLGQTTIEHTIDIPHSCLRDGAVEPAYEDFYEKVTWGWQHFDPAKGDALLEQFRRSGTGWVPTLVVTDALARVGHDGATPPDEETAEEIRASLRAAARLAVEQHRAGGMVGLGTDFPVDGVLPGESVHREMELFVTEGGATPLEALQIATIGSARILRHETILGAVEPGRLAHMVALRGNPLEDITNTRRIAFVVHDGRVHHVGGDEGK